MTASRVPQRFMRVRKGSTSQAVSQSVSEAGRSGKTQGLGARRAKRRSAILPALTHHDGNNKEVHVCQAAELLEGSFRDPCVDRVLRSRNAIMPAPLLLQSRSVARIRSDADQSEALFLHFFDVKAPEAAI